MVKVVAAVLAFNEKQFAQTIAKFGSHFTEIQVDVCTTDFVNIETVDLEKINILPNFQVGWHLMTNTFKNIELIEKFDTVNLIIHVESNLRREQLEKQLNREVKWGLAINPETEIKKVINEIDNYDFIQLMGVKPGKQGQEFNPLVVEKIVELEKIESKLPIWIDGGINEKSVVLLHGRKIDTLVVGSYLLGEGDIVDKKNFLENSL